MAADETIPTGIVGPLFHQQEYRSAPLKPGQPVWCSRRESELGLPLARRSCSGETTLPSRMTGRSGTTASRGSRGWTTTAWWKGAPFTGPPDAGAEYWRQGSPVLKYLDWRAIAMGCRGDRRVNLSPLPTGLQICEDLAMVGLARKPVMDGVYQHPSCWILDTVYRLGQAQKGSISAKAVGCWAPGSLYKLLNWPKDWVRSPTSDGYNETRLFNVLETWFLAAIVLRRWDDLASVSHAIGNAERPGTPADCVIEPAKPLLLAEVWGPRKPRESTELIISSEMSSR
eukprot:5892470-Amphidinium_carterae.1